MKIDFSIFKKNLTLTNTIITIILIIIALVIFYFVTKTGAINNPFKKEIVYEHFNRRKGYWRQPSECKNINITEEDDGYIINADCYSISRGNYVPAYFNAKKDYVYNHCNDILNIDGELWCDTDILRSLGTKLIGDIRKDKQYGIPMSEEIFIYSDRNKNKPFNY